MDERLSNNLYTIAINEGRPKGEGMPLNFPITMASNFHAGGTFNYSRCEGTEGWIGLEKCLANLEGGQYAISFASGMAAANAVLYALSPLMKTLILPKVAYLGVRSLVAHSVSTGHLNVISVDTEDTQGIIAAIPSTDVVWLESPSNPQLDVCDLGAVIPVAVKHGKPVVVDATFATPLGPVKPLALGATAVVHSGTKFIGGHSDLLLGVVVTNDKVINPFWRILLADAHNEFLPPPRTATLFASCESSH